MRSRNRNFLQTALFAGPDTSPLGSADRVNVWGVHGDRETPDPIPNSEVKPVIGDGTAGETLWESSTTPLFFLKALRENS